MSAVLREAPQEQIEKFIASISAMRHTDNPQAKKYQLSLMRAISDSNPLSNRHSRFGIFNPRHQYTEPKTDLLHENSDQIQQGISRGNH